MVINVLRATMERVDNTPEDGNGSRVQRSNSKKESNRNPGDKNHCQENEEWLQRVH